MRPAGILLLADMDQAVEEGAGGEHDSAGAEMPRPSAVDTPLTRPSGSDDQILDRRLDHLKVGQSRVIAACIACR